MASWTWGSNCSIAVVHPIVPVVGFHVIIILVGCKEVGSHGGAWTLEAGAGDLESRNLDPKWLHDEHLPQRMSVCPTVPLNSTLNINTLSRQGLESTELAQLFTLCFVVSGCYIWIYIG